MVRWAYDSIWVMQGQEQSNGIMRNWTQRGYGWDIVLAINCTHKIVKQTAYYRQRATSFKQSDQFKILFKDHNFLFSF